jgi:uncharacterized protein YecE (DUF72 family)
MLPYYSERFDTVELNNSFYHLPKTPALETWQRITPANFRFAAKGSRFLTHMKKLKDAALGLEKFLRAVEVLGEKLGPILFQLPPQWEKDLERLQSFARLLPSYHRYAFEFRNPTWESTDVYDLLERYRLAHCAFDLAGYQSPICLTTDIAYVRLHGPGGKYQGSYSEDALESWAERISDWATKLSAIYIYFDNDDSGYAAFNAQRLRELTLRSR